MSDAKDNLLCLGTMQTSTVDAITNDHIKVNKIGFVHQTQISQFHPDFIQFMLHTSR